MKKIFTLAAAVLASVAMMAQTLTISEITPEGNWYGEVGVGRVANKSGNAWSSPDMTCEGSTGYKTGSSYFTIQTYQEISGISVWARSTSNRNINAVTVSEDLKSGAQSTSNVEYERTGGNEDYAIPKNTCDNEFTLTFSDAVAANSYIQIVLNGNAEIVAVTFIGGTPSTDPVLNVDKEDVTLAVTAAEPSAEAVVKFTGKNLAAGEYALNVPNVADLTVSPTSVTVGEDGKLNAQVTITYASTVDVAAASTAISLTIGELSKSVAINYSAALAKQYLANSLNIEQLVLDNGVGYDIAAAFAAANIDYNNIDALDSLNDDPSKTNRNYAFLGLKLKKADAKLGCWLQAGHSIKIRFGNVGASFLVSANGSEQTVTNVLANTTVESANELPFTATEDTYLEIICNSTKTLVVKQIMLDEDIQAVTLPDPVPTGINNAEEAVKTVKVLRNGQLFIEKNGVLFNAQGARL